MHVDALHAAMDLAKRNIRVNCISPGPTDTPMMPAFEDFAGKEIIDTFTQGAGRRSRPEEQAYPLIFLNSRAASYVSGENFITDGGTFGAHPHRPPPALLRRRGQRPRLTERRS